MQSQAEMPFHEVAYDRAVMLEALAQAKTRVSVWREEAIKKLGLPDGQPTGYTTDEKTNKNFIMALTELLETNINTAQKLCNLHELLRLIETDDRVNLKPAELDLYHEYMRNLEVALSTFQSLNFTNSILPPNAGPVDAMALLGRQISSPMFTNYEGSLTKLTLLLGEINQLCTNNLGKHEVIAREHANAAGFDTFINMYAFLDAPYRLITQMGILSQPIKKYFNQAWTPNTTDPALLRSGTGDFIVETATSMVTRLNERQRARENATYEAQPELVRLTSQRGEKANLALCNELLKLNINNPLLSALSNEERQRTGFLDRVLKTLLVERPLCVGVDPQEISLALGMRDGQRYDPSQFSPERLQALYNADRNPLWIVLKSTIPIGENFTAQQKVQAYIDVANLYVDRRLGKTNKHIGVYEMAKAAFAVAEQHPSRDVVLLATNAFSPRRGTASLQRQLRDHQFGNWMVSKSASHKDNIVNSEFLAARDLKARILGSEPPSSVSELDSGYPTSVQSTPKSTPKSSPARSEDELRREEDEGAAAAAEDVTEVTPDREPTRIAEELKGPTEARTDQEPVINVHDFEEPAERFSHEAAADGLPETSRASSRVDHKIEHPPKKDTTTGPGRLSMFANGTLETLLECKAIKQLKVNLRGIDNPVLVESMIHEFKMDHYQGLQKQWSKPIIDEVLHTIEEEAMRQTDRFAPGSAD